MDFPTLPTARVNVRPDVSIYAPHITLELWKEVRKSVHA